MEINEIQTMNIGSVKSLTPYVIRSEPFDIFSMLYPFSSNGRLNSFTIIVNGN